jgi:glycosyltransferase involved in cell wall biosynthesis
VGRLSQEKGIETLLGAWSKLDERIPLRIIGDGPCRGLIERAAANDSRIVPLGSKSSEEVFKELRAATCLVMPSVWYETFGRIIIEAFANGTPVIASRLGCMEELVEHGKTGLLFESGDSSALAESVRALCNHSDLAAMRQRARLEFESKYDAEQSFTRLLSIYERAIEDQRIAQSVEALAVPTIIPSAAYGPLKPTSMRN